MSHLSSRPRLPSSPPLIASDSSLAIFTPFHLVPSAPSLSSLPHLMPYSGLPSSLQPYCYHTWGIVDILMALLLVKSSHCTACLYCGLGISRFRSRDAFLVLRRHRHDCLPSILSRLDLSPATDIKRTANIHRPMLQVCATANTYQHMSRTSRATPHPRPHVAGLALLYIGELDHYWYVLHPSLVARTSIYHPRRSRLEERIKKSQTACSPPPFQ